MEYKVEESKEVCCCRRRRNQLQNVPGPVQLTRGDVLNSRSPQTALPIGPPRTRPQLPQEGLPWQP